ncbi:MAG: Lipoprotein signal peptidase [Chlamydiia bacterium]|nr:Lipoprotein signal peptidase [Chlamydiia bacterium]MCH9624574.1 Lipoprotein signal peptidase [Chlamydiia bacterium]
MKRWIAFVGVPVLFLFDFLLKQYVMNAGSVGDVFFHMQVLPFVHFDLSYVQNRGMAWGMFASFQSSIFVLRVLFIGVIAFLLVRSKAMQKNMFAYLLILFGAAGNVMDTLMYGFVVDMLHFTFWGRSYGIFNIADAMIFLGAFIIIFSKEKSYAVKQ